MSTVPEIEKGFRAEYQINSENDDSTNKHDYQENYAKQNPRFRRIRPKICPDFYPSAKYEFYTDRCITLLEKNIIDTYERMNPFYCGVCKGNCDNDVTFQIHMREQRNDNAISRCGYTFLEKLDIWIQFYARFDFKVYCCQVCEFKSTSEPMLSKHIMSHIGEKPFACPLCKLRFPCKLDLIKHIFSHVIQIHIEEYLCLLCGDICTSTEYYKLHVNAHANNITYSCYFCTTYKCETIQDLIVHSTTHSSSVSKQDQDINIENHAVEMNGMNITNNNANNIKQCDQGWTGEPNLTWKKIQFQSGPFSGIEYQLPLQRAKIGPETSEKHQSMWKAPYSPHGQFTPECDSIKDSHSTAEETDTASENEDTKMDIGIAVKNELVKSETEDNNNAIKCPTKEEYINYSIQDPIKEEYTIFRADMVKEEITTHENYSEITLKQEQEDNIIWVDNIKTEFLASVEFDIGSIEVEEIYVGNQQ